MLLIMKGFVWEPGQMEKSMTNTKALNLSPGEYCLFKYKNKLYTALVQSDMEGNPVFECYPPQPELEGLNISFDNKEIKILPVDKQELINMIENKELSNKAVLSLINYLNLI